MDTMARRTKKPLRLEWQRAYQGYTCWLGKKQIGEVHVQKQTGRAAEYLWKAGQCAGQVDSFKTAKLLVEQAARLAQVQLALF